MSSKNYKSHKLSILIPVRNEKENIAIMLKILHSVLDRDHEIIIIYDSPDDNSISNASQIKKIYPRVKFVRNTRGRGVANAVNSGFISSEGEYILLFAVDEVGPVLAIEDMIKLMDEGCDLVSCTRYAYGGRRLGGSILEGFLSRMGNAIFHMLIKSAFTDSTTGIKMFRRTIFEQINLESKVGWAFVFELSIKAQEKGFVLGEVPIVSIDRLYGGKSTFSPGAWLKEYGKWFMYGIYHSRNFKSIKKVKIKIPKSAVQ